MKITVPTDDLEMLFDGKTLRQIHEEKWAELSDDVKTKAVAIIQAEFTEDLKEEIRGMIRNDPNDWCSLYHHGWGTGVRNLLREKGLTDDMTPDGNWDDYYVMVVEEAVK
jgi:hypothetical protein